MLPPLAAMSILAVTAGVAPTAAAATSTLSAPTNGTEIADRTNPHPSAHDVQEALKRLRADGMLVEAPALGENHGPAASANPDLYPRQAATFGRSLFNGVAFLGGQVALDLVLTEMGYDPEGDLNAALADINSSIAELTEEVRRISEQVEQLLAGQDRANFYNSYTQAGIAAANLDTALRSVNGWIERDLQPTESNLSDMQTVITTSLGQLDFLLNNPTTGTVPLMMKAAEPAAVSDLENYWKQIEVVRDDNRAVLAQGLTALSLMQRWDTSGTIAADLATFTPSALQTVRGMYRYGVALDADRVHVKGSATMMLPAGASPVAGESEARVVGDTWGVRPLLTSLADAYQPSLHGGQTLEHYLTSRGVPTSINYSDTYFAAPRDGGWRSVNTVGRISGDSYGESERVFGQKFPAFSRSGYDSAMAQAIRQRDADQPGVLRVHVSLNVGGRATNLDPATLERAAVGAPGETAAR